MPKRKREKGWVLPFTSELYLRVPITFLVDTSLFESSSGTAIVGADADVNFFLAVSRLRESTTCSIFPSDARSV
jgi:hypothetical protein